MNNMNPTQQIPKIKIADLNADLANEFVKNKLIRPDTHKALITTSQIRKFLSAVNCLENKISACDKELPQDVANEIKYLKVKLAYQVGREVKNRDSNQGLRNLYNEIEPLISQIGTSKENFTKVARYIEAIVAYHKFNGGE